MSKPKEPAVVIDVDAPVVMPVADIEPSTCGRIEAMNDYAARVRSNQGSDMGKEESRARIIAALEGQGYTNFDGLNLPA